MFKRLNPELFAAAAAMIVSIAALFVAWDQSQVMRAQQHASVWPVLQSDVTIDSDENGYFVAFDIHNLGVGPALIKYAELRVNGQAMVDFETFDRLVLVEELTSGRTIRSSSMSGIIGANQSRSVLKISWPIDDVTTKAFSQLATKYSEVDSPNISLVMCYCSVFDKCWYANEDTSIAPHETDSCPDMQNDPIRNLIESLN